MTRAMWRMLAVFIVPPNYKAYTNGAYSRIMVLVNEIIGSYSLVL